MVYHLSNTACDISNSIEESYFFNKCWINLRILSLMFGNQGRQLRFCFFFFFLFFFALQLFMCEVRGKQVCLYHWFTASTHSWKVFVMFFRGRYRFFNCEQRFDKIGIQRKILRKINPIRPEPWISPYWKAFWCFDKNGDVFITCCSF